MNKSNLDYIQSLPLSDNILNQFLDGDANVWAMVDFNKCKSLDDVFGNGKYKHCIILIVWQQVGNNRVGHWVVLFKSSDNKKLYYADSYGEKPFNMLYTMEPKYDQTFKILDLIKKSKYKDNFYYNGYKFQESSSDIQTCGRWCIFFLIMNSVLKDKFNFNNCEKTVLWGEGKYNITKDNLVSFLVKD